MTENLLRATIDSRFDNVWLIGVTVRAIAAHVGFSPVASVELELAIVEALNNSIEHSYQGQSGNRVEFSLQFRNGGLEFTVADEGLPVPAEKQHSPEEQAAADEDQELSEGGRGIAIIRQVMDGVEYRRLGNRNELHLSKHLVA